MKQQSNLEKIGVENERQKRWIRIFHTVCTTSGLNREYKEAIYESYNVTTSKDLTVRELQEIVKSINGKCDNWRKKVIAAIGGWLVNVNYQQSTWYVKNVACRAAKCNDFNKIPLKKLQSIYNTFLKKEVTVSECVKFKSEIIDHLKNNN